MPASTKWQPRISTGLGVWLATVAMRPWSPSALPHGGSRVSGSGIPNAYVQRREAGE